MPPTYFIALLIISIGLHFILPITKLIYPPYNYSGVIVIIFGIVINLWTDSLFKKNKTTVKPHEMPNLILASGPFRISRHPMYLGMASILFGTAIIMGSLITFIFPIIFIILMEYLFIRMEEKNMEKKFGDKFLNHKKKIRRWI